MKGAHELDDLLAFLAVARERSFTRAAAKLGVSQSALSHRIRALEARLGLRLLSRTTCNLSPTTAGERLLTTVGPRLEEIDAEVAALSELRDKPAGTIRITASDHAADAILWPKLETLLARYPDIKVEIAVDYALTDIVAQRLDAGVRFGEQVAKGRQGKRALSVRVDGQLVFNAPPQIVNAALAGFGLAYVLEDRVGTYLRDGRLVRTLEDWCPLMRGYHLYYPSRRQSSPAFAVLVDALRYRGHDAVAPIGDGGSTSKAQVPS